MSLLLRFLPSVAAAAATAGGGEASPTPPPRRSAALRLVSSRRRRRGDVACRRAVHLSPLRATGGVANPAVAEGGAGVVSTHSFPIRHCRMVEGKVSVRVQQAAEGWKECLVIIRCDIEGKWVLHWGITYDGQKGREWDQPPEEVRPQGSVPIKNYAVETPFKTTNNFEGQTFQEVQIKFSDDTMIAAINFVLKEEDTGSWLQFKGRDFRVSLKEPTEDENVTEGIQGISILPGPFEQIPSLRKAEGSGTGESTKHVSSTEEFTRYEEFTVQKEDVVQNLLSVTVRKGEELGSSVVEFDTDIPGQVIVHWGLCRDSSENWEIPTPPYPVSTEVFRQKALQTLLQPKKDEQGSSGLFPVSAEYSTFSFVLKLNEYTWIRNVDGETDFKIPLTNASALKLVEDNQVAEKNSESKTLESPQLVDMSDGDGDDVCYMEEIINEIRNLVTDVASQKGKGTKSKEAQRSILQEIEKLASEAYNIFRSSAPTAVAEPPSVTEEAAPSKGVCSGTGSGHEILCQGFNWESHKSGRWYLELAPKAKELASLGFSVVWLPPPTESVSPEGYMPKDLYNLNSRYGNIEELKSTVQTFHDAGIKVLGDVVLNHRCAHFQNQNGVWNLFGGKLNWDDRAVVADDPHFQGRGNKSSGDNFHAAPNIDHSQEFVRKDLKEWLCWLRKEVGYDGWRLDFVRGFWGGYVKDYLEASSPYFAVGEYWDSLSYTYGEMDYNQDAHRQRIIDWINATGGTAGAFDVTTKGILHNALGKCEYWRLSDEKGHPPGVVGWWPSRAVTFIENHDTGSTQGHWRFPSGKEMQGYAYILTHPGTPAVFYDHIFSHYQEGIKTLIALRRRQGIHCRSTVKIIRAERDVYAAEIDDTTVVKIGPGHYEPPHKQGSHWKVATEGHDYKVWVAA